MKRWTGVAVVSMLAIASATACAPSDTKEGAATMQTVPDSAGNIAMHLMKFDTLDFVAFSVEHLDRFAESHDPNITVTFPDGHETHGLPKHLEDMRAMFVALPDLRIGEHPIKIANGSWTAVTGRMTGTFTKPMPIGNGKFIQPTGKKLDLTMATIGHWNAAGLMDHEWLFWDNQAYMTQLGIKP